ncbi:hypothetical protein B0H19DRAFT_1082994 [Mycena capillaripes]|nr:hypothetical protein B0H19DRAFT_1082994 [Mycena capillaripes]
MTVVESPIRDGEYRVWIHGWTYSARKASHVGGLVGYKLSIPVDGEPQWLKLSLAAELGWSLYHSIPYSGHTLELDSGVTSTYRIYPPTSPSSHAEVQLRSGEHVDVARYSGALTFCTSDAIVVQYYK